MIRDFLDPNDDDEPGECVCGCPFDAHSDEGPCTLCECHGYLDNND